MKTTTFNQAQKTAIALAALNRARKLNPERAAQESAAKKQPAKPPKRLGLAGAAAGSTTIGAAATRAEARSGRDAARLVCQFGQLMRHNLEQSEDERGPEAALADSSTKGRFVR